MGGFQESETAGKGVLDSPGIQLEIHVKIQETVCFIPSIWDSPWDLPWDSGIQVKIQETVYEIHPLFRPPRQIPVFFALFCRHTRLNSSTNRSRGGVYSAMMHFPMSSVCLYYIYICKLDAFDKYK